MSLLKGANLGETFARCIFAVLILIVVWQAISGGIGWWRSDVWKERAHTSNAAAEQAQAEAASANVGAQNATATRQGIDLIVTTVPAKAEASAQRIEKYAPAVPAPVAGPADPDVMRELEEAEASARAAANRLQRKGTR